MIITPDIKAALAKCIVDKYDGKNIGLARAVGVSGSCVGMWLGEGKRKAGSIDDHIWPRVAEQIARYMATPPLVQAGTANDPCADAPAFLRELCREWRAVDSPHKTAIEVLARDAMRSHTVKTALKVANV